MDVAVGEVELEGGLGEAVTEIREGSYKARSIVENGDGAGARRGRCLVGAGVVLGAASDGDVLEDQALAGRRERRRHCGCVLVMLWEDPSGRHIPCGRTALLRSQVGADAIIRLC